MKILRHPATSRAESAEDERPAGPPAPADRGEKLRRLKDLIERGEYEVDEELLARRIAERWFKQAPPRSD